MKRKMPRCPKCGKPPIEFMELFRDSVAFYEVVDGIIQYESSDESSAYPYKVHAYCACGYSWVLRGISQMGELEDYVRDDRRPE
jgi:hypothetical protein